MKVYITRREIRAAATLQTPALTVPKTGSSVQPMKQNMRTR